MNYRQFLLNVLTLIIHEKCLIDNQVVRASVVREEGQRFDP